MSWAWEKCYNLETRLPMPYLPSSYDLLCYSFNALFNSSFSRNRYTGWIIPMVYVIMELPSRKGIASIIPDRYLIFTLHNQCHLFCICWNNLEAPMTNSMDQVRHCNSLKASIRELNIFCDLTTIESRAKIGTCTRKCSYPPPLLPKWHRLLSFLRWRFCFSWFVVDCCSHCGVLCLFYVLLCIVLWSF